MMHDKDDLKPFLDKYCYSDTNKCPICTSSLLIKPTSHRIKQTIGAPAQLKTCNKFPYCKGSRHLNGEIWINDALRLFLTGKVTEEIQEEQNRMDSRFRNLDL